MTATTILPDSEDDWDVSRAWAWSCWSRDFSDVTEIGPSSYDFIRIWQNDPVSHYSIDILVICLTQCTTGKLLT